jgi:8-oxo-dGTP pyrophosphatase MutT (NUDIX family)
MMTLKEIEDRLSAYVPKTGNGDGALNPGMPLAAVRRDAAVLILLIPQADGSYNILFTERTKHLSSHAGQISFPGGGVEAKDKDAYDTALRETAEEIGLDPANARVLGQLGEYVTRTGFRVTPVVAVLETPQEWTPQASEVARIFDVPIATIAQNLSEESLTFEGGERRFYGMTHDGAHIWGATAGMLKEFIDHIWSPPPANDKSANDRPAAPKSGKNDKPAARKA